MKKIIFLALALLAIGINAQEIQINEAQDVIEKNDFVLSPQSIKLYDQNKQNFGVMSVDPLNSRQDAMDLSTTMTDNPQILLTMRNLNQSLTTSSPTVISQKNMNTARDSVKGQVKKAQILGQINEKAQSAQQTAKSLRNNLSGTENTHQRNTKK